MKGLSFYKIRRIFRNLKNWWPIIVEDNQFDSEYIDEVLLHKLKLTRDWWVSGEYSIVEEQAEKTIQELNEVIEVYERYLREDYFKIPKELEPEHHFKRVDTEESGRNKRYTLEVTYPKGSSSDLVNNYYKEGLKKKDADRKFIYNTIRDKGERWWD